MRKDYLLATGTLVLILMVIAINYGSFLHNYFAFDDAIIMEHVLHGAVKVLRGYHNILRVVANLFFWPLSYFSWFNPLGFNLFSIALLFINAITLFFFVRLLSADDKYAALTAILFAGSSVGCDAVFWKAAFATQLNLCFYLFTLIAYVRFRQDGSKRYYLFSIVLFLFAMLSKEEAASLPFVIVLLELLIFRTGFNWKAIRPTLPYGVIIIVYIVINYILIYHVFREQSELVRHSSIRPLHTLLNPWTVFFISPQGFLNGHTTARVLTAVGLTTALLLTKDRRLLLFGIGWVFFTFLPQSISSLSEFEPKYIFNSISRHLYLPSVGASLVLSALLIQVRERVPLGKYVMILAVIGHLTFQYGRVQKRGAEWAEVALPLKTYLEELGRTVPRMPPNTHFFVESPPTGRAYMQLSMRAFYRDPTLEWIVNPETYRFVPNVPVYFIQCFWLSPENVKLRADRLN